MSVIVKMSQPVDVLFHPSDEESGDRGDESEHNESGNKRKSGVAQPEPEASSSKCAKGAGVRGFVHCLTAVMDGKKAKFFRFHLQMSKDHFVNAISFDASKHEFLTNAAEMKSLLQIDSSVVRDDFNKDGNDVV